MGTWSLSLGDPKHEAYFHHGAQPSAYQRGFGLSVSLRLPTPSQAGQGQGLKHECLSSLGAAADPAPSGGGGPLGLASLSLSLSLSHISLVSASAFPLLSLSWSLAPLFPLSHPGCNWEYRPCPRTVQRARLASPAPGPSLLGDGFHNIRFSVALVCSRVLGFHLPGRQTEAPGEKQSDREKQKACSSWPCHLLAPHPRQSISVRSLPPHSWLPGSSQAAPEPACVTGSSSIPGCLLLPDFIREKVWEPRAAGRMAGGKCPAPQSRVGGGRPGREDVGKVHPVVPRWSRR